MSSFTSQSVIPMQLRIHEKDLGFHYIVALDGRVDSFHDRGAMEFLWRHLDSVPAKKISLDLSKCSFLSLAFMRGLQGFRRELEAKGGEFSLLNPSHSARRQLDVFVGMQAFKVFSNHEELRLDLATDTFGQAVL